MLKSVVHNSLHKGKDKQCKEWNACGYNSCQNKNTHKPSPLLPIDLFITHCDSIFRTLLPLNQVFRQRLTETMGPQQGRRTTPCFLCIWFLDGTIRIIRRGPREQRCYPCALDRVCVYPRPVGTSSFLRLHCKMTGTSGIIFLIKNNTANLQHYQQTFPESMAQNSAICPLQVILSCACFRRFPFTFTEAFMHTEPHFLTARQSRFLSAQRTIR